MTNGVVALKRLERGIDVGGAQRRGRGQCLDNGGTGPRSIYCVYVYLEPVARGEHNGARDGGGDHNRLAKRVGTNTELLHKGEVAIAVTGHKGDEYHAVIVSRRRGSETACRPST